MTVLRWIGAPVTEADVTEHRFDVLRSRHRSTGHPLATRKARASASP